MKRHIAELEGHLLVCIAGLASKAYGVSIQQEIQKRGGAISLGMTHSALTRLEEIGLLKSWLGDASPARGNRRKRFFELTDRGRVTLHEMQDLREERWKLSTDFLHAQ